MVSQQASSSPARSDISLSSPSPAPLSPSSPSHFSPSSSLASSSDFAFDSEVANICDASLEEDEQEQSPGISISIVSDESPLDVRTSLRADGVDVAVAPEVEVGLAPSAEVQGTEMCLDADPFTIFSLQNPSSKLSDYQKELLITMHPIQPITTPGCPVILPFDPDKVYFQGPGEEQRLWLSFCKSRKKLYCWVCFGFATKPSTSFSKGWGDAEKWLAKRCYVTVPKHENSREHLDSVTAYHDHVRRQSVDKCIDLSLKSIREKQISERREVLLRIINIVLYLSKQGHAFRGSKTEAAYTLPLSCNHGNFLEEVKSRAKFDPAFKLVC